MLLKYTLHKLNLVNIMKNKDNKRKNNKKMKKTLLFSSSKLNVNQESVKKNNDSLFDSILFVDFIQINQDNCY